jgi:hypothetical protein
MGSEDAHGCAQNSENGFGFDFLQQYHKDSNDYLNHIVQVTADETWVSFANVEIKEQSKQYGCTYIHKKS